MRLSIPLVLAFAAAVAAQSSGSNVINNPPSGIEATAGEPLTISWTNPTSGTITIKLQTSGEVQPDDGIVVAENIPNTGAATFNVPPGVSAGEVFVQIIDDSNPSDFNFSGGFEVQGATNTAVVDEFSASASAISATDSDFTSSASDSTASARLSDSMSVTSMSASASVSSEDASSSASSESASSSASSGSALASSSASGSSRSSSSSSPSRTSASATIVQSTSAPTSAATPLKVQTGLVAAVLGAAAALLY